MPQQAARGGFKHEDYTVGWICALPIEQAVISLDEQHEKLPVTPNDTTYIFGRIDVHNVVIACLPSIGEIPAARCAAHLESSFKSLRFLLMVGVGGGVPTRHDIRLGDIVVGMPGKKYRGVVQYDFGTRFQDQHLAIRESHVQPPPEVLLTAVKTLESGIEHGDGNVTGIGKRLEDYVTTLASQAPSLRQYQRPTRDILSKATYRHRDEEKNCEDCRCDISQRVYRSPRTFNPHEPKVFTGLIASGNKIMRDAIERDRLSNKMDVLCFEMEAAGLTTGVGCLVIRGICDYCDSHKNKDWQPYAAAVAAAYARELLKVVPGIAEEDAGARARAHTGSTSVVFSGPNNTGVQIGEYSGPNGYFSWGK